MSEKQSLLVIGAGIAGITAALEAAEAGAEVILVEREPYDRRPGHAHQQLLPQDVPPVLRHGDQHRGASSATRESGF